MIFKLGTRLDDLYNTDYLEMEGEFMYDMEDYSEHYYADFIDEEL